MGTGLRKGAGPYFLPGTLDPGYGIHGRMDHSRVPCRPFLEDFSAFVDGELSPGRRAEVQAHVDCCQACLDHLTAYRRGITVLRSLEAEEPFDFWTRLESRLWMGDELRVIE